MYALQCREGGRYLRCLCFPSSTLHMLLSQLKTIPYTRSRLWSREGTLWRPPLLQYTPDRWTTVTSCITYTIRVVTEVIVHVYIAVLIVGVSEDSRRVVRMWGLGLGLRGGRFYPTAVLGCTPGLWWKLWYCRLRLCTTFQIERSTICSQKDNCER